MWLLYAFGLVDGPAHLIVLALEDRFLLRPHCQNHLQSFTQALHPARSIGIIVAIGAILVLVPASANTEIEPPMREHIDGARHLCQQCGVAIAITRHNLADAHALRITRHGCGGGPALE